MEISVFANQLFKSLCRCEYGSLSEQFLAVDYGSFIFYVPLLSRALEKLRTFKSQVAAHNTLISAACVAEPGSPLLLLHYF